MHRILWKISKYKTASLSIMGRISLSKHALSMISQYTLRVFKPPMTVAKDIDRCIAKFIWLGDKEGEFIRSPGIHYVCRSFWVD